ncbi:GNAT family N-acyltransferase [Nocardia sp. NPDC046763]|uniref:N-acyl amino acid synthase FeeM domain-containing protein n=1 Tax=Nocardia sp. NPDC046763 TaxID=3155256 RepID=UPI0033D72D8B
MTWQFTEDAPPPHTLENGVFMATRDTDYASVDAIWREVYGHECGWLPPDAPALHDDRYHENSAYLIAVIGGRAVGTMRLVRDSDLGLPVEQFASIRELRGGGKRTLIECQRLMIVSRHRNTRVADMPYGVFAALVKGCLHWCIRNGYTHIVADLFLNTETTPMAPLLALGFDETGIKFVDTELSEPDESVALLLEIGELFSRPFRSGNPFYRYLMEPDANIAVYS